MGKTVKWICVCAALCAAVSGWAVWSNQSLVQTVYTLESDRVPQAFDGFRIAQVSDLHNRQLGRNNKNLLSMLSSCQPDIIVFTGDMIDSRQTDIEVAVAFAREAVKIAPCYYVPGNHESRLTEYADFKQKLLDAGVTVLEDSAVNLERYGARIVLQGVKDPGFQEAGLPSDPKAAMGVKLQNLPKEDAFTVLLSHRPELFPQYREYSADLVFTGHAHGGQIRLPWIGGLYTPHQGWFPEYDAGVFTEQGVTMIVSRGVGNSAFPLRVNNRPEVVIVELKQSGEEGEREE